MQMFMERSFSAVLVQMCCSQEGRLCLSGKDSISPEDSNLPTMAETKSEIKTGRFLQYLSKVQAVLHLVLHYLQLTSRCAVLQKMKTLRREQFELNTGGSRDADWSHMTLTQVTNLMTLRL